MAYQDPFARELTNLNINSGLAPTRYVQGATPAPVVAPPTTPAPSTIKTVPKPMTPASLQPTPAIKLPEAPQSFGEADTMIASVQAGIKAEAERKAAEIAAQPTPEALKNQSILDEFVKLSQGAETLPQEQLALEQAGGIPQLNQQKAQIDTQIAQKIAEGQALDASYQAAQTRAEGSNFNLSRLQGEQAQNYRMYLAQKNAIAAEAGILQATSLGVAGQIQAAQATADRAIDLKFKAQELKQNTLQAQLNALRPTLDAQEKRRADLQQAKLDKQKQDATDLKNAQKEAKNNLLNAGVNDSQALTEILNATSASEVNAVEARFAPQLSRMGQLDIKYKEAQLQNVYSQMQERGVSAQQYDPEEILAYARERASTGKTPTGAPKGSYGLIAQISKELPQPDGALVDRNTGVKSTALSATQEDGILALYDISKKVKELAELDKKRIQGLIPAALGKTFGTEAQGDYIDLRDEIIDLLARARTGAALTKDEESFYKSQLPGRVGQIGFVLGRNTQSKIENFSTKINGALNTRLQGQGTAIYGYSKVKVGDTEYKVGDIISNGEQQARVNPDGTLTIIQ